MRVRGALLSMLVCLCAHALLAAPREPVTAAHYFVFEIGGDDSVTMYSHRLVSVIGDLPSQPDADPADPTPARWRQRLFADVRDSAGRRIWHTKVDVDRYAHSESAAPDGTLMGQWFPLDTASFALRVPAGDDAATLEITARPSGTTTTFLLSDLPHAPPVTTYAPAVPVITSVVNGSPANRLDILILGDGYTAAQSSKFDSDTTNLINVFLSLTPYKEYKNYVNVTTYFVASPESGADHPPCADPYKLSDPLEGTYRNTAFDAAFCWYNTQRNLEVNNNKVLTAAAAVPNWDKIFVAVNDTMYGGSGGPIAVTSVHPTATNIIQHEFGHSFTALTDEYTSPFTYPACSDVSGGTPCEPNATNQTVAASIKWSPWILGSTPIPTPNSPAYNTVVGLFQGARYSPTAYYRPMFDCLMNHLGVPFCTICRQAYILKLYRGGWGAGTSPAAGVDLIEPGSESPPAAATVSGTIGAATNFSATILQPVGGPPAQIEWLVDGAVVPGATSASFSYTPSSGGAHTIVLRVTDLTSYVNGTMALVSGVSSLQRRRTWNMNVSNLTAPAAFSATGTAAQAVLSWSAVPGATSYEMARSASGTAGFVTIGSVGVPGFSDPVAAGGYLYRVRAVDGGGPGPWSATDLATVFDFADPTLVAGSTPVLANHVAQLRTAINQARTAAGLGLFGYSRTVGAGMTILASDVVEMRQAANEARAMIGMPAFTFTDSTLSTGLTAVRAIHINDLRSSIR